MLLNLHVKNLAIIDEVDIDFSNGLNIMTGETGAGKSIIIGSINLALGAKVSKDIIREGAQFALVELVFSSSDEYIKKFIRDADIEAESDEIIITRKITSSRSISKVNGETVTLSFVHNLAQKLIDIHGQHDNRMLIDASEHINILDGFIRNDNQILFDKISKEYNEYINLKSELSKLDVDSDKRLREISLLEYEINEIESAALKDDEDVIIDEQFKIMSNMENVASVLSRTQTYLNDGCMDNITRAIRELSAVSGLSEELKSMNDALCQTEDLLGECIRDMDDYVQENEFNQSEYDELEKRVDLINLFKAKYGDSIEAIREYLEKSKEKLDILNNFDEHFQNIKNSIEKVQKNLEADCEKLSEIRKEKAEQLSGLIVDALKDLNFNDAVFSMEFSKKTGYSSIGVDDVTFMIRTNAGEALKPLAKIASGGELSRVMLAIKSVVAGINESNSFIFDEIDAGISGRTAQKVAQKLANLAKEHQIICITHLAQIAAMADSHYVIEKKVENMHTFTNIRELGSDEITDELSRIIGGAKITQAVIDSAKEMKELANNYKES